MAVCLHGGKGVGMGHGNGSRGRDWWGDRMEGMGIEGGKECPSSLGLLWGGTALGT